MPKGVERIWKYELEIEDAHDYVMPKGAELLHVAEQHGRVYLWVRVDENAEKLRRRIYIYGTGFAIFRTSNEEYVGTVVMSDGIFVWHIYDGGQIG